ncbi:sigma-70 family RNA polymerase sigma factor [Phenylobacterium sp. LjRoot219]|uniref:RNA polymerase sigma factor n=1 Tax=Phenylobacterium sp. LjRoot219 TaxID=3342283 RepID=UPI003ED0B94C
MRSDPLEEAALFERIAARDLRAFESLYRLYHPRLARFLTTLTRRPALVEEVLNDTLYAVWSRPEAFGGRSKLSTWIFAIAYRKALKALSRQDEPMDDGQAWLTPSDEAGPDQLLEERETRDLLARAIAELPPDKRAVVTLCYFHDMPYRDIAEVLDCPVDTVKTRMFHARRHLKSRLAGPLGLEL